MTGWMLTVNAPPADLLENNFLDFYVGDCRVVNGKTGQEYEFGRSMDFVQNSLNAVLPGGSSEGWFGYVVDKNDLSPVMLYRSLDDRTLYYKADEAYEFPDDKETYKSVIPEQNPITDTSRKKGAWKNPYEMGDIVKLDYNPTREYAANNPFAGSIQVLEVYRGNSAKQCAIYAPGDGQKESMEPVVLKIKMKVDSAESGAVNFSSDNFMISSSRGSLKSSHSRGDVISDE